VPRRPKWFKQATGLSPLSRIAKKRAIVGNIRVGSLRESARHTPPGVMIALLMRMQPTQLARCWRGGLGCPGCDYATIHGNLPDGYWESITTD
jgi:hypothetical protein